MSAVKPSALGITASPSLSSAALSRASSRTSPLAKFHAGFFRISLALCAQVLLWKNLVQITKDNHARQFHPMLLSLPSTATNLLWLTALLVLISLSILYTLRCYHHFDKVKDEFLHHVGVNYLFAPWMSSLLLLQTSPMLVVPDGSICQQLTWWMFVVPIIMLDIKLYGQWFIKGKRVLTKVANPACQLSVIANLVAAKEAMFMGWSEMALCFFALSMAHYLVLFVTLYQRHPGSNGVSPSLRPVFFLFIATPSMASIAWCSIAGSFDVVSKMLFFLSMFLFMSLVMFANVAGSIAIYFLCFLYNASTYAFYKEEKAKTNTNSNCNGYYYVDDVLDVVYN
ncbi:S-type anion channel SLAH1-like [Chenopodium quinoa]|uniref:S-type anion channel SLAH1-like n=1 Tax=Chenopodium quinoa TaxID=63459 RepID=UPI000B782461|nr:S-type anion channel SLAH1-like [Chenopodium quinoa]